MTASLLRPLRALLCLVLFLSAVAPASPAYFSLFTVHSSLPSQDPRIRSEVNLVNIIVGVLDASGKPIPDLPKEAFAITEEGAPQKIELFEQETDIPLDIVLMIDTSLSTLGELETEREAAAQFIQQVVREDDRLAVFQFADRVTQVSSFSADVRHLQSRVRSILPEAGTSLYDAVLLGSEALAKRTRGRRRVIILVTDAGETTSSATFDQARNAAITADTMLYTVLIRAVKSESGRNTAGEHALVTITDVTGGAVYQPDTIADLPAMFDRINQELRTQYRLGYYPTPRPPARSYRRVAVHVSLPATHATLPTPLTLHHRKAYFAP